MTPDLKTYQKHPLTTARWWLVCLACVLISCGSAREADDTGDEQSAGTEEVTKLPCDHTVRWIQDTARGCDVLLVMANGTVLEPSETLVPEDDWAEEGTLRISMEIVNGRRPGCVSAMAVAKITCLEVGKDLTGRKGYECEDPKDVFTVPWMKQIMDEVEPHTVSKYDYRERLAYSFRSDDREVIVDCYGVELCRKVERSNTCGQVRGELSNARVILVVNNGENDTKMDKE